MSPPERPPRRPQTQTERDTEGFAARRAREAAVPRGEFTDEVTGRYDGEELERRRAEREIAERLKLADHARDDIRELRADAKKQADLVSRHDQAIETYIQPAIGALPGQLEAIKLAQAQLNTALESAVTSSHEIAASISHQLQAHNHRIGTVEADQRATATQLATVDRTAIEARAIATDATARITKLEKRSVQQGADLRRWWRRHLGKAIAAALTLIAGAIAGAISSHFGGH